MSETQLVTGAFVNEASTPFFIPTNQFINRFVLRNLTVSGVTALGIPGSLTSDRIFDVRWSPTYSYGTALIEQTGTVSNGLAPKNLGVLPQNGIYLFNAANQAKGANIAVASFVPGTTTVFTTGTNHGFIVGDNVRIFGLTTAPELGGLVMTVTAVTPTTFTTLLDSTNSLTSVGFVYRVGNAFLPQPALYYPEWRAIAGITQASPCVITLLVRQVYHVGDKVRFQIPTVFGMPELNSTSNGLPVEFTIVAVDNTVGVQTITIDVDSTAFTAFAWPAAASYPFSLPICEPQGEGNTNNIAAFGVLPNPLPYGNQNVLSFATQNQGMNGILIGVGDGTNAVDTGGIITSEPEAWEYEIYTSQQSFPNGT